MATKVKKGKRYGSGLRATPKKAGPVYEQDGRFFYGRGPSKTPGGPDPTPAEFDYRKNPFSDFERQWYIKNDYGDPLELVRKQEGPAARKLQVYTKGGSLPGVTMYAGRNGQFSSTRRLQPTYTYVTRGVSAEARDAFLRETGGYESIEQGDLTLGSKRTVMGWGTADKTGMGTIQQILASRTPVPIFQDPNAGRSQLLMM